MRARAAPSSSPGRASAAGWARARSGCAAPPSAGSSRPASAAWAGPARRCSPGPASGSPAGRASAGCWGPASCASAAPASGCWRAPASAVWAEPASAAWAPARSASAPARSASAAAARPASTIWMEASPSPTRLPRRSPRGDPMPTGYFALVLHAHLPFVRHPEDPTVMEERWLFEAISGTYLPLLQMFEGLVSDGVHFRCTVSLSPPLITMLTDDLLKERYAAHLDGLIRLAEKELDRTRPEPHYHRLAQMYHGRFQSLRHTYRCHDGDLVRAFARLQDAGVVEVITATATHAFFPLLDRNWAALRAQVHTAADLYERHFHRRSKGIWLGECGYIPGVDELLREAAIRYFLVDSHGLLYADHQPAFGVYAPLYCPSGVAAFGRDTESSEQVWSAKHGYPGDPHYRDFYRDIGFDLPLDYIGPYIHPEGHRMATGFKYQAITHDKLHDKWVYDPNVARGKAGLHASHFRGNMEKQAARLAGGMDRPPIIVSPYDAELYGHWWYEGPVFLGDVFRQLHHDQSTLESISCGDYLDRHATNQVSTPCASS